jgi:hypothetical protein
MTEHRVFDERCMAVFANEREGNAFRHAVSNWSTRRFIDVSEQLALAQEIMGEIERRGDPTDVLGKNVQYIKDHVTNTVRALIYPDPEERQRRFGPRQRTPGDKLNTRIKEIIKHGNAMCLRLIQLGELLEQHPQYWQSLPELGRLLDQLEALEAALKQFQQTAAHRARATRGPAHTNNKRRLGRAK